MYKTARRGDLDNIAGRLHRVVDALVQSHFSDFCPTESWAPAINAYHLPDRIEVCVDLAGVDRASIDVRVEPGRLLIRGIRPSPEPPRKEGQPVQILAMEIDHGPFERAVRLPLQVEVHKVKAEQHNGLLWIRLPLRRH